MFENLKNEFIADQQEQKEKIAFYIQNGYMTTWAAENRTDADRGLKQYSTETRWTQYTAGKISREKAVEYAVKRYNKKKDAETAAKLAHLDRIANAEDINDISVYIDWKRSATWGYNPTATAYTDVGKTTGKASGCGYDKESAAIASAFNEQDTILKILYTIKENALKAGVPDRSATACTGRNNTECCGYGAGYSVLPYFEGGVGSNCFWNILKKAGFSVKHHGTAHSDAYTLYR